MNLPEHDTQAAIEPIAIIGLALRFPGSQTAAEFWANLRDGVDAASTFTDEELRACGLDAVLLADPHYVKTSIVLENIETFDAAFFGYTPREAEVMDPAQRLFLECAWEGLETAGYDSAATSYRIGVFAGSGQSTYLLNNLLPNRDLIRLMGGFEVSIGTDKDFLPTRVSYKLNLNGPSLSVNTACSTSLVAVHLACQSLLTYQSDMALAGGATVRVPQTKGYFYQAGGIASPDGHCRAFDARGQGTVEASGVGVVVLKRLADAVADGDTIYAVIKSSAVNNDGAAKVGYTAPSVDGQTAVISEALSLAGVSAETISYVEAHGTATRLGDPVEIAALTQAFRASTVKTGFCAIGSVKTNIGHLDTAAGVAGLIKTVLALYHQQLPPSLHCEQPNPLIDFAASPFYVNVRLQDWPKGDNPRRAGVSSFGIGGTNAHLILEEAPPQQPSEPSARAPLLVLSAKTPAALEQATDRLAAHLQNHPALHLADVAYTLSLGRHAFPHRRVLVAEARADGPDVARALAERRPSQVFTGEPTTAEPQLVFLFSGQGAQTVNMARGLYETEPDFRTVIDQGTVLLQAEFGLGLRSLLYPPAGEPGQLEPATQQLTHTTVAQPALFLIEYALAQLWMSWGITPTAMLGHSVGEYVAACVAGVFSFEDGLRLVAQRGRLMGQLPSGAMLAVSLSEQELRPFLGAQLGVAAVNGPALSVASGPQAAVTALQQMLEGQGVAWRRLHTSHAFHSSMMEPILPAFTEAVARTTLNPPQRPYLSNLTGTWITADQATDPHYWAQHLRQPVRFAAGLQTLFQTGAQTAQQILLEVGPGSTLTQLATHHPDKSSAQTVLTSLPPGRRKADNGQADSQHLLTTLAQLWLAQAPINWTSFYRHERRHRLPLPSYPFERQRYWIEAPAFGAAPPAGRSGQTNARGPHGQARDATPAPRDLGSWFSVPSWQNSPFPPGPSPFRVATSWLILSDGSALSEQLVGRLQAAGSTVVTVRCGPAFAQLTEQQYVLSPGQADDYEKLLHSLSQANCLPEHIVHLWTFNLSVPEQPEQSSLQPLSQLTQEGQLSLDRGLYSLVFLSQVLGRQTALARLRLDVISNGLHCVTGQESGRAETATLLAVVRTIPHEYPHIQCRNIDFCLARDESVEPPLLDQLWTELTADRSDSLIAYRAQERKTLAFAAQPFPPPPSPAPRLQQKGVYLVTGGLGGIGLTVAQWLAKTVQAKLGLLGRSPTNAAASPVQELEALGAQVCMLQADVADQAQMDAAVSCLRTRFGPINGVIHAAGIADGALLQRRTRPDIEAVLAPKLAGTRILDSLLQPEEHSGALDFIVLCSSLAAFEAPIGQVAYTAANTFLDAFAEHKTHQSKVFTVSINWDSWTEVGMAVAARHSLVDQLTSPPTAQSPVSHPLFSYKTTGADGAADIVYVSRLSEDDWVLGEHRLAGTPTLPATAYLEMACAALSDHAQPAGLQIEELYLLSPLRLGSQEQKEIHTVLRQHNHQDYELSVRSKDTDGQWHEHATAKLCAGFDSGSHEPRVWVDGHDFASLTRTPGEAVAHPAADLIETSPRWQTLTWVRHGTDWAFACHQLQPEFAADIDTYHLHPALLDTALNLLVGGLEAPVQYLPFCINRLCYRAALPTQIYSLVQRVAPDAALSTAAGRKRSQRVAFDITIVDEHGQVLVSVEGYSLRRQSLQPVPDAEAAIARQNVRLALASLGVFDSLHLQPALRRSPAPGEVEIEVCAAGLNFKEVLRALGVLEEPGSTTSPLDSFGLECAGRIVGLGEGVSDFQLGEAVIGFADACFARFTTTPAALVTAKPAQLSDEEAAGIPIAFTTAYYALCELGRLAPGERVLIHSAAGGVGLAAVQVARWRGAEIFATAGNPEKRDFLHSLGIQHVFDSRTVAFADELLTTTHGRGVDVVLNSLGGDFIPKSIGVLAPYGRFLEIGKLDIYKDMPLGLKPFARSLSFFAINIGPEMPCFRETFDAVVSHFAAGHFQPLPTQTFSLEQAAEAFALMAQRRHTGKIVLVPSLQSRSSSRSSWTPMRHTQAASRPAHSAITNGNPIPGIPDSWIDSGIRPAEGIQALQRILATDFPHVLVSTQPIHQVLQDRASLSSPGQTALAQPNHPRPALSTAYVAARTQTEEVIARIWQTLLGLEPVGVQDDFFELGGHSLLSVQLVAELRQRFQIDLPISTVFDFPTIESLSQAVEKRLNGTPAQTEPQAREPLRARQNAEPNSVPIPLSYAQQGLWFFDQLWGGSAGYNLPGHLRLTGPLQVAALEHSLKEIVRRHAILRTTFPVIEGSPVQHIQAVQQAQAGLSIPVIDLQQLVESSEGSEDAQEGEVRRLARAHVEQPFDLQHGPLWRLALVRLAAESHILLLTMHHIIADGWSMGIFVHELCQLYPAVINDQACPLPDLPVQYADFATWQRETLQPAAVEHLLAYWKRQLADAPDVLELPTRHVVSERHTMHGRAEVFSLDAALTQQLKQLSGQSGTTLFMTLLAAFGSLLSRYSGQLDLLIGSPVATRHQRELEPLIGLLINTVVLRIDLSGNPSFQQLLARVHTMTREAFAHQDLPFEKLVEELRPPRQANQNPLVQVLFALQNVPLTGSALPSLRVETLDFEFIPTAFDLMLTMLDSPNGLTATAIYNTERFDRTTIRLLVSHFQTVLAAVVAQPDHPVLEIPLSDSATSNRSKLPEVSSSLTSSTQEVRQDLAPDPNTEEFDFDALEDKA